MQVPTDEWQARSAWAEVESLSATFRRLRGASPRSLLSAYWQGPRDLLPSVQLEWRLIAVRLPSIVLVLLALPLLRLPSPIGQIAYGLLGFAVLYVSALALLVVHAPEVVANGYLPSAMDAILTLALIHLAGGIASPFYAVAFTVSVASAMRYGYGPSLLMPVACLGLGLAEYAVSGQALTGEVVLRPAFLALVVAVAGCLTEQKRQAEREQRQRARRATLLNEVSASLAQTLDLSHVWAAIPAAIQRLFGPSAAGIVLQGDAPEEAAQLAAWGKGSRAELQRAQLASAAGARLAAAANDDWWRLTALDGGETGVVLLLAQTGVPATAIAWSLPASSVWLERDRHILTAFCDAVRLATDNASLYRRLVDREQDLQSAYAALSEAHQELVDVDELKSAFLANVSHEFRTPLTSIQSFSEMLMSYDCQPEEREEFVSLINTESERLTRMIGDVLDITRIESGSMEWNMGTVDLGQVLAQVAKVQRPLIEKRSLTFEEAIDPDLPPAYGDPDRIQQVVSNLLNNALKFTSRGRISLGAWLAGEEVVIEVADTGIGIALEDQELIFDKFQQVSDGLRVSGGTGLGLSICRDIIAHHKGRIWVQSTPGQGSSFKLALRLAATPAAV